MAKRTKAEKKELVTRIDKFVGVFNDIWSWIKRKVHGG